MKHKSAYIVQIKNILKVKRFNDAPPPIDVPTSNTF